MSEDPHAHTNSATLVSIVQAGERVREAVAAWPPASGDRERWDRWDQLLTGIGDINGQLVDLTAELVNQRNALQARVEQLEQELYSRSESNGG